MKLIEHILPDVENIPRVPILEGPTPVKFLEGISKFTGVEIWMKDDGVTSSLYGGNKARKFEFIIGEALVKKAQTLVTSGGTGTNHGVAAVVFGRKWGLRVVLHLFEQYLTEYSRMNYQALLKLADEVHVHARPEKAFIKAYVDARRRAHAFYVPPGGSTPVANLGYVLAALELWAQIDAGEAPFPEKIFVPAGSLGTACGLIVGSALIPQPFEIVLVRVVDRMAVNSLVVHYYLWRLKRLVTALGGKIVSQPVWHVEHTCFGRAYGEPTPEGLRAMELFHRYDNVRLEPVYTAKSAAALLKYARRNTKGPLLLWKTNSGVSADELLRRTSEDRIERD